MSLRISDRPLMVVLMIILVLLLLCSTRPDKRARRTEPQRQAGAGDAHRAPHTIRRRDDLAA